LAGLSTKRSTARKSRPTLLTALARIEAREGRYVESAQHFREAMDLISQSADPGVKDMIDLLIEEARTWKRAHQFDKAMEALDLADEKAVRAANIKEAIHSLDARATLCEEVNHLTEAAAARIQILRTNATSSAISLRLLISAFTLLLRDLEGLQRLDEGLAIAREFWPGIAGSDDLSREWDSAVAAVRSMISLGERWQAAHPAESIQKELDQWRQKLAQCEAEARKVGQ
jgi:tetratricopeptide (TPR) repeat protein